MPCDKDTLCKFANKEKYLKLNLFLKLSLIFVPMNTKLKKNGKENHRQKIGI